MRNIFFCPQCNKLEINFQFDGHKQRDQKTWLNLRGGYGRAITHIICPECKYELSGFMNVIGIRPRNDDNEDLIEYVKFTIQGYSDGSYCDTDKLLNMIRNRK